jgi:hypothetical protein
MPTQLAKESDQPICGHVGVAVESKIESDALPAGWNNQGAYD